MSLIDIFIFFILLFQFFLLCSMILIVYLLGRGLFGVPWIRTNEEISKAMLELAGVKRGDMIVDYGCGDGTIVITAAKQFGANGIGFEYIRVLALYAKLRARYFGVSKLVQIRRENFLCGKTLPKANIITSYLYPEVNAKLEPLLVRDYPSGTRVVSRTFLFPTLPLITSKKVGKETLYLYQIP